MPYLSTQNDRESIFHLDGWLAIAVLALICTGLMAINSVNAVHPEIQVFRQQLAWLAIGIVPFLIFWKVDANFWERAAGVLYLVNIALLILVIAKGHSASGAQRWLNLGPVRFQPSEMSKLLSVLTVSAFFSGRISEVKRFSTFALSFVYVLPVLLLVYKQPHLGATMVIFVSWLGICIIAGVKWRYLFFTGLAAISILTAAYHTGKLNAYQAERIQGFFVLDEKDKGYQQFRSNIAFASGGLLGTGYMKGTQKKSVPEQETDFIFSAIGEEGGLIGCTLVLLMFGLFFARIWMIMLKVVDPYSRMVATGIFCIFGFHFLANLGMNLSVLPVIGLWLPFISYGGTALWLCLACFGLLLNLNRRKKSIF